MIEIARSPLPVLLIAPLPAARDDLRTVIEHTLDLADVQTVDSIDAVREFLARGNRHPELVILSADQPYAWTEHEVADLWNLLPAARWVIVLTGNTRSALRHVPSLPAGSAVTRERLAWKLRSEQEVLEGNREPLPWTCSLEELVTSDAASCEKITLDGLRVGLFTADRDLKSWWRQLIESSGGEIVSLEQRPDAVLWDLDPSLPTQRNSFSLFHRAHPQCHVVGLRNTVNEQTRALARQLGINQLLPKLSPAELLLQAISPGTHQPN